MNKCTLSMFFVMICAIVVQQSNAQSNNFFSNFFTLFRRASRPSNARPNSSSSSSLSINQWSSSAEALVKTITMTMTETETSEMMVTSTMSEFFTVTETITERLIATSTLTRKMTATATQIVTSCPVQDIGLRRINWKEIPNRIEEIMKRSGQPALEHTVIPEGPYIIRGRNADIESSIEGEEQPQGELEETLQEDQPSF
ncbi:hypothetical protein GHT06_011053 [Daphnia sinensis]|uniref:Uncharacterized protein n=1 Tax=Daphnia sinensis TaxID=1820382 RepID=A0AAD5L1K8_9CRUS|nr:hypothetical protein GHT06_011053 [Daphnia sinensis]